MHEELPEIWPEPLPPLVLIAQPDEVVRAEMAEELSDYRCETVSDGREAFERAVDLRPDAIIADYEMPGCGGVDLCRRLQLHATLREIPVAMTIPPEEAAFEAALEAGAVEVITMPFTPTELRLRLQNMVRGQVYLRALERKNHIILEALKDLKESETMLVHAEKLSMLGEMSAGIVHEINNPLNYSKTALFVLRRLVDEMEGGALQQELSELVGDANDGVERVGRIVRDLRAFAMKGSLEVTGVDLCHVVRTATRLMGDRLSNIRYLERMQEGLLVRGNENNLCQVMLNLIKNGVEATEAAGRSLDEAEIRVTGEESRDGVVLRVRDNGCGIPAGERASMFEPFFTTKGRGRGMGLGLSICRRILEDHGASIEVESVPGQFTEFILRFPPGSQGEPEEASSESEQVAEPPRPAGLRAGV